MKIKCCTCKKLKFNHSILLVSPEKNFFMITIMSMMTLDLTKSHNFFLMGDLREGDGESCWAHSAESSSAIDSVAGVGHKADSEGEWRSLLTHRGNYVKRQPNDWKRPSSGIGFQREKARAGVCCLLQKVPYLPFNFLRKCLY